MANATITEEEWIDPNAPPALDEEVADTEAENLTAHADGEDLTAAAPVDGGTNAAEATSGEANAADAA